MHRHIQMLALACGALAALAATAEAQSPGPQSGPGVRSPSAGSGLQARAALAQSPGPRTRSTTGRSRLELAFDHGYGFSSEGDFLELGLDVRAYAPAGIGAVLRVGVAAQGLSNAEAGDLGVAFRTDLISTRRWGVQLAGAVGASLAVGPFDAGRVAALGAFGMAHLDLWVGVMFVGIGVSGHALWSERHSAPNGRGEPITAITPVLRVGFDWGV